MFWNLTRKSAPDKGSQKKTRKLRLESLEQRQMLSVSPIGHFLGPIGPGHHERPIGPVMPSPFSPGRHEPIGPVAYSPFALGRHEHIQETTRVSVQREANGVTQVTINVAEDFYIGSNRGRLIAKEDVQVVADVKGTGNLQIDVTESESVAAPGGRGLNMESLTQSVDVRVDISAGHFRLNVTESESVVQGGRGLGVGRVAQSEDVLANFKGAGRFQLNVDEFESVVQCGRGSGNERVAHSGARPIAPRRNQILAPAQDLRFVTVVNGVVGLVKPQRGSFAIGPVALASCLRSRF